MRVRLRLHRQYSSRSCSAACATTQFQRRSYISAARFAQTLAAGSGSGSGVADRPCHSAWDARTDRHATCPTARGPCRRVRVHPWMELHGSGWLAEDLEQDAGEIDVSGRSTAARTICSWSRTRLPSPPTGPLRCVAGSTRLAEGLASVWRQDPNLVVSPSTPTTIADGIDAIYPTRYRISPQQHDSRTGMPSLSAMRRPFHDPESTEVAASTASVLPRPSQLYLFATIASGGS